MEKEQSGDSAAKDSKSQDFPSPRRDGKRESEEEEEGCDVGEIDILLVFRGHLQQGSLQTQGFFSYFF